MFRNIDIDLKRKKKKVKKQNLFKNNISACTCTHNNCTRHRLFSSYIIDRFFSKR